MHPSAPRRRGGRPGRAEGLLPKRRSPSFPRAEAAAGVVGLRTVRVVRGDLLRIDWRDVTAGSSVLEATIEPAATREEGQREQRGNHARPTPKPSPDAHSRPRWTVGRDDSAIRVSTDADTGENVAIGEDSRSGVGRQLDQVEDVLPANLAGADRACPPDLAPGDQTGPLNDNLVQNARIGCRIGHDELPAFHRSSRVLGWKGVINEAIHEVNVS